MLSSVLFVLVLFVSVDFNNVGILKMDGSSDNANNSAGPNQSAGNGSSGPNAPNAPAMIGNSDNSAPQQNNIDPTLQDFKNASYKIEDRVFDYVDYDPNANQFAPTPDPNNDLNTAEKEAVIWARNDVISGTGEVMPEACKKWQRPPHNLTPSANLLNQDDLVIRNDHPVSHSITYKSCNNTKTELNKTMGASHDHTVGVENARNNE